MEKFRKVMDKITGLPVLRRKALYIVLIVVLSIAFLFGLTAARMGQRTPGRGGGFGVEGAAVPGGSEEFQFGEGEEFPTMPDGEESPSMPDGGEFPTMPDGEESPSMPDGGEFSTMPDGEESPSMPDGEEFPTMPGGEEFPAVSDWDDFENDMDMPSLDEGARGNVNGIFRFARVLMVVSGILDALCIFLLVYLIRKKRRLADEERQTMREQAEAGGEVRPEAEEHGTKRHPYRIWIILAIIVVALILLVRGLVTHESAARSQTEATLHEGVAERTDITEVLPGAGTLTEQDAEDLSFPEGVKVQRWVVSDGEEVQQGQVLAVADRVSVMDTIVEAQEKLDALDAELAACEDQQASGSVTAAADGRVIEIYAQEGVDVTDTMYDHSALMLLSLDGLMAVTVETDESLAVGDTVLVALSDGTQVEGRVDSKANRTAVITVSDDGPALGDAVTVTTEDGTPVGEGSLYIHSEWKATGFVGTVSDIAVSEGDEVDSGATLLTLSDTENTGTYDLLLEQRALLESQMETLFEIYTDGYIYAPGDGVISNLDESLATEQEDSATASSMVSTNTTVRFITLGEVQPLDELEDLQDEVANLTKQVEELTEQLESLRKEYDALGEENGSLTEQIGQLEEQLEQLQKEKEELEKQLEDGGENRYSIGTVTAVSGNSVTITYLYGATGTGTVELPGRISIYKDGKFRSDASSGEIGEGDVLILIYAGDTPISAIVMSLAGTDAQEGTQDGAQPGEMPEQELSGENEENLFGDLGDLGDLYGDIGDISDLYGDLDMDEISGLGDVDLSALSEADALAAALADEVEEAFGIGEQTLLSITPQDTMCFSITVDEMDILNLQKGQTARVTLDAFPGQSFEGTVTAVHRTGTNSGGSTKYTADITIGREEGMLAGMNASAQITIDVAEGVLCIPEAALVEENGLVYVYTAYDENSDTLGGLVEVTCGISDGTNVEILSGLEEGSPYYYKYLDVVNYESASSLSEGGLY